MMGDSQTFQRAFEAVVAQEGDYTNNAADPGNWTGGRCGAGSCKGTKFGISAASYPSLDIAGLDLAAAADIYRRDYWDRIRADELPPALALLVFDAAVNNGIGRAVRWLQQAVGTAADGVLGDRTMAKVRQWDGKGAGLLAEFMAQRMFFMASLPTWRTFGLGWSRRLARLPYDAIQMGGR